MPPSAVSVLNYIFSSVVSLTGVIFAFVAAVGYTVLDLLDYHLRTQFKPTLIFVYTSTVLFCCCVLFALVTRLAWRPASFQHFMLVFLAGFFTCMTSVNLIIAIFIIGPGNAVALVFTMTIFILLFNVICFRARLKATDVLFSVFSTLGVGLISISLDRERLTTSSSTLSHMLRDVPTMIGVLFGIICAAAFAALFIVGRMLSRKDYLTPPIVSTLSFVVQYILISITLCTAFNEWALPDTWRSLLLAISPGLADFTAIMFVFLALRYEKPTNVSIIMTSEVIMTYAAQSVLFSFPLEWKTFVGALLIVCSCVGVLSLSDRDDVTDMTEESDREGVNEDGDEDKPILK